MKKKLFILTLVFALVVQLSCAYAATNLIANGGIEAGSNNNPEGWGNWTNSEKGREGVFFWDDKVARSGSRSLKIDNGEKDAASIWGYPVSGLEANKTYIYSGYIKTENVTVNQHGQSAQLIFKYKEASGADKELLSPIVHGTQDWTYVEIQFTLPEGFTNAETCVRLWGGAGTAWFDDLSLIAVEEDTVPAEDNTPAEDTTPVAEENTSDDTKSDSVPNPKTGDINVALYALAAVSSLAVLKRNKK